MMMKIMALSPRASLPLQACITGWGILLRHAIRLYALLRLGVGKLRTVSRVGAVVPLGGFLVGLRGAVWMENYRVAPSRARGRVCSGDPPSPPAICVAIGGRWRLSLWGRP